MTYKTKHITKKLLNKNIIFSLILFLFFHGTSFAQLDNYYLSGAKKGIIDTLARHTSEKVVQESTGLLEKEIDPEKYVLGPGDVLTIAIMTAKPYEEDITISPEGKLLIPTVGIVDLKGNNLAEGIEIIKNKISKVFKTDEIYVVLKNLRKFKVTVSGAVSKPSIVSATAVDRVSEIIERAGGLKFDASVRKIKLYRESENEVIRVDLLKYYLVNDNDANPTVLGGDHIIIPPSSESDFIAIEGEVGLPGLFEFVPGDSLSQLIRFAHGFIFSSLTDSVEIVRYATKGLETEKEYLNLTNWRNQLYQSSKLDGDIPLKSGDRVYVRKKTDWHKKHYVVLSGEVMFPGLYSIDEGKDRVKDIINRAGGFKENASMDNAFLIRKSEEKTEDKEMERLKAIPTWEMTENELRYYHSRINEIKGVMSINFKKIVADANSEDNILLKSKDSLVVPEIKYFVNVQGRVNNPGLVVFKANFNYLDYINQAGGYGFRADESSILVVKSKGTQFLAKDMKYEIEPGDYILVPPESETTFMDVFTKTLTIVTNLVTIAGVVIAIVRL